MLVGIGLIVLLLPGGESVYHGFPRGANDYKVNLNKLYQKTGLVKESAGRTCADLLSMGMTDSGVYWLKPDSYQEPYQAYCDMKSFGGGWQMCYTSKYSQVHLTDDAALVYNASLPYKSDGYTSNCKNVPFNQVIYIYHAEPSHADPFKKTRFAAQPTQDDQKAYFTYETTEGESLIYFVIAGNSGRNLVSPAIQLHYADLNRLKKQYYLPGQRSVLDSGDKGLPFSQERSQFPGSVPSNSEAEGLFEVYANKLNIKSRTTDFWRGRGVAYKVSDAGVVSATDNWKYELVVCDEQSSVPVGLFMSGLDGDSNACFKSCNNWCEDTTTDYYRASSGDKFCNTTVKQGEWCVGVTSDIDQSNVGPGRSVGTAFLENGYSHTAFKLMSVGIRYRVHIRKSHSHGESGSDEGDQVNYPFAASNI